MGPDLVVVATPGLHGRSGVVEVDEPVQVEARVPELAVEALHVGVLRRLARVDEAQPDAIGPRPAVHGLRRELRPVVDDDDLRQTARLFQLVQDPSDPDSRDRGVREDVRALSRPLVHDRQAPEPASRGEGIADEVHRPSLVPPHDRLELRLTRPRTLSRPASRKREPFGLVDPIQPLVIHSVSLIAKKIAEKSISTSRSGQSELTEPPDELFRVLPSREIPRRRPPGPDEGAGSTLADADFAC